MNGFVFQTLGLGSQGYRSFFCNPASCILVWCLEVLILVFGLGDLVLFVCLGFVCLGFFQVLFWIWYFAQTAEIPVFLKC